ncbi:hypothetical protein ACE103_06000 [Bradyrhizobium sp. ma5]|uniref:hypothetical protein n=1 Tax=unclassified Bradyrhizobium TaxID=2631580 RepID=UPI001CC78167|nr:hypothetical protein [Bradyrhizobium sp. RD5-C2]GIQ75400.1 hypothetical protein BraRD5C2_38410 [Bradyrhizobium sp. RD5-C2]
MSDLSRAGGVGIMGAWQISSCRVWTKFDFAIATVKRTENALFAFARTAEHVPYTPVMEALDNKLSDRLRHGVSYLGA